MPLVAAGLVFNGYKSMFVMINDIDWQLPLYQDIVWLLGDGSSNIVSLAIIAAHIPKSSFTIPTYLSIVSTTVSPQLT